MIELKESGKHTLVFGCWDDMRLVGRIILHYDEIDELDDLVKVIVDCNTYPCIIGEYEPSSPPIKSSVKRLEDPHYKELVKKVIDKNQDYPSYDCGGLFHEEGVNVLFPYSQYGDIAIDIINNLKEKRFCSFNRVNKYYAYGFAIDFVRFDIHSKMCSPQLTNWEMPNTKGEVVAMIIEESDGTADWPWPTYSQRLL